MRIVSRCAGLALGIGAVLAATAWAAEAPPPAQQTSPADPAAVRAALGKAVCTVTAENAWGVPQALATGFLLGDGRFVVTDLGAVARPGVEKARIAFSDGITLTVTQFGLAAPGLGLVLLRTSEEQPSRRGLTLAADLPALEGTALVSTAGWRWAKQSDVTAGRLWRGVTVKDIAQRTRVEAPAVPEAFLRVEGPRLDAAFGAVVVDAAGAVLGVRLDFAALGAAIPVVSPAPALRQALMSASPELKPLKDLPKPLWPVQVLRMKGEPAAAVEFGRTCQGLKGTLVCPHCKGKGKIDLGRGFGGWMGGRDDFRCPGCGGDGISVSTEAYASLATWAEQGTRLLWAPTTDEKTRTAVRAAAAETLRPFAAAGSTFRRSMSIAGGAREIAGALEKHAFPRGGVFYAQVVEPLDGPGGKYLRLEVVRPGEFPRRRRRDDPAGAPARPEERPDDRQGLTILVRLEDLPLVSAKPGAARREPPVDTVIVMAGAILGQAKVETGYGLCVLPLEWLPAPLPASAAAGPMVPGRP